MILMNSNGVIVSQKKGDHARVINAKCGCGSDLLVAPPMMQPEHERRNPIMVCSDHFVHAYWFKDLVMGKQLKIQRTNDFE